MLSAGSATRHQTCTHPAGRGQMRADSAALGRRPFLARREEPSSRRRGKGQIRLPLTSCHFFAPVMAAGIHGSRSVQVEVTKGLRPHALIGERDRSAIGLRQADDRAARHTEGPSGTSARLGRYRGRAPRGHIPLGCGFLADSGLRARSCPLSYVRALARPDR